MTGARSLGPEVARLIHTGLTQLRSRNGFHDFEHLCLDFARAVLDVRFMPATGPVGAGGDQGRDFETHVWVGASGGGVGDAVGLCTTQSDGLPAKIRSDLDRIAGGNPVDVVFAFLVADLPIRDVHTLQAEALAKYGIRLEVLDGNRLATMMATEDFAATAFSWLRLPPRILSTAARTSSEARQWAEIFLPERPRPELHEYLVAIWKMSRKSGLRAADRIPDLDALYKPLLLTGPDGHSRPWEQVLTEEDHVIVSGSAGAGKSALLRHIATTLADRWLRPEPQPWVPVLIQARDLASGRPLEQALRAGIERILNVRLLRQPDLDFLDRPSPASRWLILVDGLDEVVDPGEVLAAVEAVVDELPVQFMIASRPFGHDLDRDWCAHHALQSFDRISLDNFIATWFPDSGWGSESLHRAAREQVYRLEEAGWEPNPLFAVMACTIADTAAGASAHATSTREIYSAFTDELIKDLKQTHTPAIDAIQNRFHQLLEYVASHRHFEDPNASVLDLALRWADEQGIQPPDPLRVDWQCTVREVLLRSGLITSEHGELRFFHLSLQEYYAARRLVGTPPEQWLDALEQRPYWYDSRADLVLAQTTFLEFLLDPTNEDAFVAAVVTAYPGDAGPIVEHYCSHNLDSLTVRALESVLADRHNSVEERAAAAIALTAVDSAAGVPSRLELSIDLDLEPDQRLRLITSLITLGGPASAAIQWLIFQNWRYPVETASEAEIWARVTFAAPDEDKAAALRLIATTKLLPEHYRIDACSDLVQYDAAEAYRLFLTFDQPRYALHQLVDRGAGYWPTLHQRFVQDDANAAEDRIWVIELIEKDDPDRAEKYYGELAASPLLTDSQRAAIATAMENLTRRWPRRWIR